MKHRKPMKINWRREERQTKKLFSANRQKPVKAHSPIQPLWIDPCDYFDS